MLNKRTLLIIVLFSFSASYGQQEEKKKNKGRIEFNYTIVDPFSVYASTIPDETFHTTDFFKKTFPFIQPDEPDNLIYIRYVFKPIKDGKFSLALGLGYLHTKPDRFGEGAGVLKGLYLANGYTQIGVGVGLYYDFLNRIKFHTMLNSGPMFSNPNWKGKTYMPYKSISFLPNNYQVTGWGVSNSMGIDVVLLKWLALTADFIIDYDQSRELRATDGTHGNFHSFIHSVGFGMKFIFSK